MLQQGRRETMDSAAEPEDALGSPAQQVMSSAREDIFMGAPRVHVKREMAVLELCGLEAKQHYRISVPSTDKKEGTVFLYISEESNCAERTCCSTNRRLNLKVHQGQSKLGPVVLSMAKPFSLQGCCCWRPSFEVFGAAGKKIGDVKDPCRCCRLDQQAYSAGQELLLSAQGSLCQIGLFCPCLGSVIFDIVKGGQKVASIEKLPMDAKECCLRTNRFTIDFGSVKDAADRSLLLASAMLLDLEYFEQQK